MARPLGQLSQRELKVTERFTRTAPDHLRYEATSTIPNVHPAVEGQHAALPPDRADAQLMEFKCVEFVEELMFGEWRKNPLPR